MADGATRRASEAVWRIESPRLLAGGEAAPEGRHWNGPEPGSKGKRLTPSVEHHPATKAVADGLQEEAQPAEVLGRDRAPRLDLDSDQLVPTSLEDHVHLGAVARPKVMQPGLGHRVW